jgi:serine/threonine protein phosphatase 1
MADRTIAIGDIHGCSRALATLLDEIAPGADDTLVTLGDYIDRGPESRQVLERLVALADQCRLIPLLGNHEILLLESLTSREAADFWRQCGGDETLASYGGSLDNIPPEHLDFLRGLRPYHETDTHLFVHANYDPGQPLQETSPLLLYWEHVTTRPLRPHCSGKQVIVGHTPQASGEILDLGFLICLDTYCFGGQWLTALDVDSRRIWQASKTGQLRLR